MRLNVWVAGAPKGQPRGRAFAAGGKARIWTPGTAEAWKGDIARVMEKNLPGEPIAEPTNLELDFFFARPKRLLRKKDPDYPLPYTGTPDWDNLGKAACDALVDIGVFADDKWICHATVNKWYTTRGGRSGALIRISPFRAWAGPEDEKFAPWMRHDDRTTVYGADWNKSR